MKDQRTAQGIFDVKLEEQAAKFTGEIGRLKELLRKVDAKVDSEKTAEKQELVQSMQTIKKLEVKVRELKAKTK